MKTTIAVIVAVLAVALVFALYRTIGRPKPTSQLPALFASIDASLNSGRWETAIRDSRTAVELATGQDEPGSTSQATLVAHLMLVRSLRGAEHADALEAAQTLFRLTKAQYADDPEILGSALRELAQAQHVAGDTSAARASYGQALEQAPNDTSALVGLAILERRESRFDRAIELYELALASLEDQPELDSMAAFSMLSNVERLAAEHPTDATENLVERVRELTRPATGWDECLLDRDPKIRLDLPGWELRKSGHGHCTWAYARDDHPEWLIRLSAIQKTGAEAVPVELLSLDVPGAVSVGEVLELDAHTALREHEITDLVGQRKNRVYFWHLVQRIELDRLGIAALSLSVLEEAVDSPETTALRSLLGQQLAELRFSEVE